MDVGVCVCAAVSRGTSSGLQRGLLAASGGEAGVGGGADAVCGGGQPAGV